MDVTKNQAIKIIDRTTNMHGAGFSDWWVDMMDDFGLYDEEKDAWPSIYDVLKALGVSEKDCRDAGI